MSTTVGTNIFKVIKWSAVAEWRFDIETPEACGICKNKLTDRCIQCAADNIDRSNCEVGWGQCRHAYHVHCIDPWVAKKINCPVDQKAWILVRKDNI
jgi:RING-box protein 1